MKIPSTAEMFNKSTSYVKKKWFVRGCIKKIIWENTVRKDITVMCFHLYRNKS